MELNEIKSKTIFDMDLIVFKTIEKKERRWYSKVKIRIGERDGKT